MSLYRQGAFILRNLLKQNTFSSSIEARNIKRWVAPTLKELKRRKDRLGPQPEQPRSFFLEWNYQAEIYAFGKRLNEDFDRKLLEKALTNRSYVIREEARQQEAGIQNATINMEDNTQLINEGEKFITECIEMQLKRILPKFPQDGIDAVCKYLTSNDSLANIALHVGLKDIILCSEYPPDASSFSSTFKAVVAALRHSSGTEKAAQFVEDFVLMRQLVGKDVNEIWRIEKPLEMLQKLLGAETEARLCNQSAANTILATYQVGLYVKQRFCVGIGWGESIDVAIEMAARDGLKILFGTTDSMPAIHVKQMDLKEIAKNRAKVHH